MKQWDVYWADVPFEEDPSQIKTRPVIIAKNGVVYVLTLRVTSHEPRVYDPYDYPLKEWKAANLNKPSTVRIRKLAKLAPNAIRDQIGTLHPADVLEIQCRMQKYREERNRKRL